VDLSCNEPVNVTIEYPDGHLLRCRALIARQSNKFCYGELRQLSEITLTLDSEPVVYVMETDTYRNECQRLQRELRRLLEHSSK